MTAPQNTGSHAVTEKRGGGLLWLWILLGALVLGALIWGIAAALDDEDDELEAAPQEAANIVEDPDAEELGVEGGIDTLDEPEEAVGTDDPTLVPGTDDPTVAPGTDAPTVAPGTDAPTLAPGVLLVGDVDAFAGDADLVALVAQPVQAMSVEVQELVSDEAFFVGPGVGETVLVRLADFAGEGASESPFVVEAGDTVSFSGTLEQIDDELLAELQRYDPSEEFETGDVYVQVEDISGVR